MSQSERTIRPAQDAPNRLLTPHQKRRAEQLQDCPTILRSGPYRLYFYSHEPNEPPHIHVDRDRATCKFWLQEIALASSLGFSAAEQHPDQLNSPAWPCETLDPRSQEPPLSFGA